jgi:hypothetical protein
MIRLHIVLAFFVLSLKLNAQTIVEFQGARYWSYTIIDTVPYMLIHDLISHIAREQLILDCNCDDPSLAFYKGQIPNRTETDFFTSLFESAFFHEPSFIGPNGHRLEYWLIDLPRRNKPPKSIVWMLERDDSHPDKPNNYYPPEIRISSLQSKWSLIYYERIEE